jgi:hypothetical protein
MTIDSASLLPLRTSEQVDTILEEANAYFKPICMSFSSCDYNIIDNYAYNYLDDTLRVKEAGIVFSLPRRINVFFVNKLIGEKCGYSYADGFFTDREAQIFIELSCSDNPAEQLAHHMGILLGLLETNTEAGEELVDGSNCSTAGDLICDTAADPYGAVRDSTNMWVQIAVSDPFIYYSPSCEFIWEELDDNGEFFTPQVSNIMSPYPCKCEFTREQYLKMVDNYNKSEIKQY